MKNLNDQNDKLMYGALFGVYSSLLMYLGYKLDFDTSPFYRAISFIFAAIIIYYAIHRYKISNGGSLKTREAIKYGLSIGLIGGILYGIYTYVHLSFIDKSFLEEVVETIKNSQDYQGREMTENQVTETKDIAISYMGSPFFYVTYNLIGSLFQAFIISLVIGLIKKK